MGSCSAGAAMASEPEDSEPGDKERLRKRFQRQMRHWIGRDEELRRKQAAKARRAQGGGKYERQRHQDDEQEETFVKIPKRTPDRGLVPATPADVPADLPRATVAAVHSNRIELDTGASARIAAHLFADPEFRLAVGDEVVFCDTAGPPRIEAVLPRRAWIGRPDPGNPHRTLVLVVNVDVAVIVVSVAEPSLRPGLIDRFLLALQHTGVAPIVCVNKVDLLPAGAADAELAAVLAPYRELGLPVVTVSADRAIGIESLRAQLAGKTCVFVGHSGVGKSSLLNAIDPDGDRRTGAVRQGDGKGRHTTTGSQLRQLGDGTRVIDTPGIRAFGVDRLTPDEVREGFAEFAPYAGSCRFGDCSHQHEPDCAVLAAVAAGKLSSARHASYLRILTGLEP